MTSLRRTQRPNAATSHSTFQGGGELPIPFCSLKIPRRLSDLDLCESNLTLHTFCDASRSTYTICVFLRAEKEGKVIYQLIQARSRVAPLKKLSIPRLELLACNIGARLADSVKKDLKLENIESFFWSDSMDVFYTGSRENA
ncbi:uncharacterized protein TNCV_198481 [Trichonephila clavipes]|nr:uncharacterized protein TNCV_198481 [Trichonephila clavipes]